MGYDEIPAIKEDQKPTPQDIARLARLRYVSDSEPGITRRRCGRGFVYFTPTGKRIKKERLLGRIQRLAIPPAWTDVWICRISNGHLQATGRDSRGRKQYRYHDRWQEMTGLAKFSLLSRFGQLLPSVRETVAKDLTRKGLPWEKVSALAVGLLDETGMRIGNREYAADNESYGLTTLRKRHALVEDSRVIFSFKGKSGLKHKIPIDRKPYVELISECRAIRGTSLFQYEAEDGWHALTSFDVNEYLGSIAADFTAKVFRTWHGSKVVAEFLYQSAQRTKRARNKSVSEAVKTAAETLGNTTTVCRNYYIHPRITELYLEGKFAEIFDGFSPRRSPQFTKAEQILIEILGYQTDFTKAR